MADFEKHLSIGLNMIPGVVVILHHLMAFALTADQLVSEKEQGLLTRTYICGLPLYLSLICQLFSHFIVIVPQVFFKKIYSENLKKCYVYTPKIQELSMQAILSTAILSLFYGVSTMENAVYSYSMIFGLLIIQAICGMCFGTYILALSLILWRSVIDQIFDY